MNTVLETAYRQLSHELSEQELHKNYTPDQEELALVATDRKPILRLGFLLHLKLFQNLGYFLSLKRLPRQLIKHIGQELQLRQLPTRSQLAQYEQSGARARHLRRIRDYLGVGVLTDKDAQWLASVAESAAATKESLPDIINVLIEELVRHRFELPGFTVLQRIARTARNRVNDTHFRHIGSQLSADARKNIDELLASAGHETYSAWHTLKREPKKPTNKEVRNYLQHVGWLRALGSELPRPSLPQPKHRQFTLEARALDAGEMARLKPIKRYALAVLLIHSQHSKALDDVAELYLRLVRGMETGAKKQLQQYLLQHQKRVDSLIYRFRDVLSAWDQGGSAQEKLVGVEDIIQDDSERLIEQCEEHIAYAGNNYFPFMLGPYRNKRALLLNCLTILELYSTSSDTSTQSLIRLLKRLHKSRLSYLSHEKVEALLGRPFDPLWLPDKWRKLVLVKSEKAPAETLFNRRYLELWIHTHIKQELQSGDLFIPNSSQFDDYREQLVDDDTLYQELPEYGALVELPLGDAGAFTDYLKALLTEKTRTADAVFPDNKYADIEDGRLILRNHKRKEKKTAVEEMDEIITRRLPGTSILDVISDTERWLDLHKVFGPLSGHEVKLDEPRKRFITTLFCYGCNLGPTQTAKSIKGISRRQVAWLNLKHVSEERLDKAIAKVVNAYNQFDLPKYWGSGKHVSADGTKLDLYEENLLSEYHIRYGGYGGIGYYHVSDTYIALFSHFIPCGHYEAVYILDWLHQNQSDVQPDTLHGDTHAQSYPVFALAYLLGIDLMPRIRNIPSLALYRPDKRYRYQHIDALFTGSINFKLIEKHLNDMLRVVISIKQGRITASTILRMLGTYSRKNKLYFAFRELGKVIRTIFLLRYITEIEVRQVIQAATNKSEEFNGFRRWLFFGDEGIIAENIRHEQRKVVKYNHLVANMVILHNAEKMTRLLRDLADEGTAITPDILAGLSPYRTAHINRYGDYILNLSRNIAPLDFSMRILEKAPGSGASNEP